MTLQNLLILTTTLGKVIVKFTCFQYIYANFGGLYSRFFDKSLIDVGIYGALVG